MLLTHNSVINIGITSRIDRYATRWAGDDTAGKATLFRWRDADGIWNYADEAPTGVDAERLLIDPDVNLITTPRSATVKAPAAESAEGASSSLPGLIDDAREARKALEDRRLPE